MNTDKQRELHANEGIERIRGLPEDFQKGKFTQSIYYLGARSLNYSDDYFLSEYKKQYGRSYIEDEAQIRRLAQKRLARIRQLLPPPARLFEIGCATGFFLDEARSLGYSVQGCEISNFASSYAQERFGLDVFSGGFLNFSETTPLQSQKCRQGPDSSVHGGCQETTNQIKNNSKQDQKTAKKEEIKKYSYNANTKEQKFDIITACYTIEHIPKQVSLFQKISRMLKKNGLLYFALPSSKGPVFEFSPKEWARTHPKDHFIDYCPASLKKSLPLYGLKLQTAWPASLHQERCQGWKSFLPSALYKSYARLVCYGDTMEGIAIKTR